jgi:hypothetical protein
MAVWRGATGALGEEGCGHDGQRNSVAQMPKAATTTTTTTTTTATQRCLM